jgi:hypothetical protein
MPDSQQWMYDRPHYVTAVVATDGSNATLVTLTLKNNNGKPVGPKSFLVYLSDSATGLGLTATTASGTVTDKTAGTTGQILSTFVAKKALMVQNIANGTYELSITDTSKTAFKVCVEIDGIVYVPLTLAAGNYG